jgi:hypothetical protein
MLSAHRTHRTSQSSPERNCLDPRRNAKSARVGLGLLGASIQSSVQPCRLQVISHPTTGARKSAERAPVSVQRYGSARGSCRAELEPQVRLALKVVHGNPDVPRLGVVIRFWKRTLRLRLVRETKLALHQRRVAAWPSSSACERSAWPSLIDRMTMIVSHALRLLARESLLLWTTGTGRYFPVLIGPRAARVCAGCVPVGRRPRAVRPRVPERQPREADVVPSRYFLTIAHREPNRQQTIVHRIHRRSASSLRRSLLGRNLESVGGCGSCRASLTEAAHRHSGGRDTQAQQGTDSRIS